MRQFAGSARYVFNRALAVQNQEREKTGRKLSGYAALCRMLTQWRNTPETAWLSESPVHTTQQERRRVAIPPTSPREMMLCALLRLVANALARTRAWSTMRSRLRRGSYPSFQFLLGTKPIILIRSNGTASLLPELVCTSGDGRFVHRLKVTRIAICAFAGHFLGINLQRPAWH